MDEPAPQDILFWDLARKSTKLCYMKCVNKVENKLSSKQETCIKECVGRYLECRNATLNHLNELSKQE